MNRYDGGVRITFTTIAAANADTYKTTDAAVWAAFHRVLLSIESGGGEARETAIRHPSGTAWSVSVLVHGRDQAYQVIWVPRGNDAWIVHLGQRLS